MNGEKKISEIILDENENENNNNNKEENKTNKHKNKNKNKTNKTKNNNSNNTINNNNNNKNIPVNYENGIDFEEMMKKENPQNSDVILFLIEICTNSIKYGLNSSNKSRLFWDELFKKPEVTMIFKKFKSETLRKYWRLINELDKNEKVIEATIKYSDEINKENVK